MSDQPKRQKDAPKPRRRSTSHEQRVFRTQQRKDARVRKSSHGMFWSVADLRSNTRRRGNSPSPS